MVEQPIGFGDRKPRELPPAGWHECALVGIYNVGRQFDDYLAKEPGKDPWRTIIKLKFESSQTRPDGKPIFLYHDCTASMFSTANLRKVVHAIVGRDLTEQEAAAFKLSSIIGKPVSINVAHVPKKLSPGEFKSKLQAFVPARDFHTPVTATEVWDWRYSDPDDAPDWVWELFTKSKDYREPTKPRVPKPRNDLGRAVLAANSGAPVPVTSSASTSVSGIEDPPF